MASAGLAEAGRIRADLHRLPLHNLVPEPGEEAGMAVDDKPNPFPDPLMADHYLRPPGGVIPLAIPGPRSWDQYAAYVAARTFRVVSQLGVGELPDLAVVGNGDGLGRGERAETIRACQRGKRPFAAVNPLDGVAGFLSVNGEGRYASVAIVARSLHHVAIAVAAASTVAVGTHHAALVQDDDGGWIPIGDLPGVPVLPGSVAAPYDTPSRSGPLFAEWGNAIMLNGVVLGGVEAAYQPACWPCDGAAAYIAAVAGRATVRAVTGRLLTHPYQVQALLINALRKGERLPSLIAARDELSAHRLLKDLRRRGIA